MDERIVAFQGFLLQRFPALKDIAHTYKFCSKFSQNRYLVQCEKKTINFDKLTEWYRPNPRPCSADSLSFSDLSLFLIEFKSGDPTLHIDHINKEDLLIKSVVGKIKDSYATLTDLYREAFRSTGIRLKEKFCIVVDTASMGISVYSSILTNLSTKNNDNLTPKEKAIFERILPQIQNSIKDSCDNFDIMIWYSDLFEHYLKRFKIQNCRVPRHSNIIVFEAEE